MTARILFHVQHLLGSGHLRRAAAISAALARDGFEVVLVSGGRPVADVDYGGARLIQLPPLRATDETFKTLVDDQGRPIDDAWRAARCEALLSTFAATRPDVLITELFPLGRRMLAFELLPLIAAARQQRPQPLLLCSVRDVLANKTDERKLYEMVERVRTWYDHVLVHGDPDFLPLAESFPEERIADRVVYTGYVRSGDPSEPPAGDGEGEIIVSVGGGAVGAPLLRAALAARLQSDQGHRTWRLLIGANLPAAIRLELAAATSAGCIVQLERRDFPGLLARCHVAVAQAGYNTVMDIIDAHARAVLVPFAASRETEQTVRAEALAKRGWAEIVPESVLSPATLAAAIDRAAAMRRPEPGPMRRDGAMETVRLIRSWLAARGTEA
jgi:predicted glycosyltransferase